ncbi:hypothetical protein V5O48_003167 [Marasmius crinis-equi]|uniref:Uncharacterized protein n=1 Tax=Marasmius crinis-equi TaxID=585013 RepID=A0ABR3FTL3_9AGAR
MQPGAQPFYVYFFVYFFAIFLAVVSAEESPVHWISPSAGDYFGSGDSVTGKWSATKAVVSPSFKLCSGPGQSSINTRSEDSSGEPGRCGSKTYPTVQQDNGVYSISLTVPNVTEVQPYYLQMMDDFDNVYRSPSFTLSPSGSVSPPAAKEDKPLPQANGGAQSPMTVNHNSQAQTPPTPFVTVTTAPIATNPLANVAPGRDTASFSASRPGPPTAAFAIPLSIIGAILLAAICVALRQNRILGAERKADIEKMHETLSSRSGKSQSVYSRSDDVERALPLAKTVNGLPGLGMYGPMQPVQAVPIPLFMPPTESLWPMKESSRNQSHYSPPPPRYSGRTSRSSHRSYRAPSVRSYVSSISSHRSATSRPLEIRNHSSTHSLPRPPSISSRSSRSSRTRVCLPPVKTSLPLDEERSPPSVSRSSSRDTRLDSDITGSVLEDYMLTSPSPSGPPPCLLPAPQRIHIREDKETSLMNPYDAVAASLRYGRQS